MENNQTTNVVGPTFISTEQKRLIRELRSMCYIRREEEREEFMRIVTRAVSAKSLNEIKSEDFGTAYLTALAILHKAGEDVFKPQNHFSDRE